MNCDGSKTVVSSAFISALAGSIGAGKVAKKEAVPWSIKPLNETYPPTSDKI